MSVIIQGQSPNIYQPLLEPSKQTFLSEPLFSKYDEVINVLNIFVSQNKSNTNITRDQKQFSFKTCQKLSRKPILEKKLTEKYFKD